MRIIVSINPRCEKAIKFVNKTDMDWREIYVCINIREYVCGLHRVRLAKSTPWVAHIPSLPYTYLRQHRMFPQSACRRTILIRAALFGVKTDNIFFSVSCYSHIYFPLLLFISFFNQFFFFKDAFRQPQRFLGVFKP